ncbi:AAA-type ATPase family protein, partial [Prunus dulcis]
RVASNSNKAPDFPKFPGGKATSSSVSAIRRLHAKRCKNVKEFHQLIYFHNRDLLDYRGPLPRLLEPSSFENTKDMLIVASFIHLEHKEHVKYTSELTTVNPCILLSGSEIYQEMLAKALAQYFGAKLLIFDSHSFFVWLHWRKETLLGFDPRCHGRRGNPPPLWWEPIGIATNFWVVPKTGDDNRCFRYDPAKPYIGPDFSFGLRFEVIIVQVSNSVSFGEQI